MDIFRRRGTYVMYDLLHQEHYTPDELAVLLDMSSSSIYHDAREGRLRASIVDHHVVDIRRDDVLRWLQDRGDLPPDDGPATSH